MRRVLPPRRRWILTFALVLLLPVCTALAGQVDLARTGQETCYDDAGAEVACAGTGQDGETFAGTQWPATRFLDNGDGTLTDELTGLVWLADANCAATAGYDPDDTGDGTMTWANVLSFVAGINAGSHPVCAASHDDWRVPNVIELETLVNAEVYDSTWLESQGFTNIDGGAFWSSTTYLRSPINGIFVDFYAGAVSNTWKEDVGGAWPVRGGPSGGSPDPSYPANPWASGQTTCYDVSGNVVPCIGTGQDGELQAGVVWPSPRFNDNGDGTVTDELTGLVWLQDANCVSTQHPEWPPARGVTWQAALDFVAGINDGTYPDCGAGQTDWQLPNRRQLLSLMDYSQINPSLPAGHPFLNAPSGLVPAGYWSSTTYSSLTSWAWNLYHRAGQLSGTSKTAYEYLVWPVRASGVPPPPSGDIGVTPTSLEFGSVILGGESDPLELTLANSGDASLSVTGMVVTGDDAAEFTLDTGGGSDPCGTTTPVLDAGESCTVAATFAPSTTGAKSALVRISSEDPDEPLVDVILGGTGTTPTGVAFPDDALESAIRVALELPSGDITPEDLESLTTLELSGLGITDLTGLEYCTSLETLILSSNQISDLDPLTDLVGLSYLNLYDNQIVDVSPLSGLFTLVYLSLGRNQITNIAPLAVLTNLTDLYLDSNQISATTALGFLSQLVSLGLSDNQVSDLGDLVLNNGLGEGDRIWVEDNPLDLSATSGAVADIRTLQDRGATVSHDPVGSLFADAALEAAVRAALVMPDGILLPGDLEILTTLDASSQEIGDLEGLQYCIGLTELYLHDNRIAEISQLAFLTQLTTLNLSINQVDRVVSLGGLAGLTWLNLSSNHITEIDPLEALDGLTHLFLSANLVADISYLAGLENLTALALSDNDITDIEALMSNFGLGNGDTVWLSGNPLELWYGSQTVAYIWALENSGVAVHHDPFTFYDTGFGDAVVEQLGIPLEEITREDLQTMRVLDARDLDIADIRGVSLMLALESLYLQGNRVSDLSPLSTLTNLQILDLEGNLVVDLLPLAGLTSLSQLDLSGNPVTDISPLADNPGIGAGDLVWLLDTSLDISPGSAAAADIWTLLQRGAIVFHLPVSGMFPDAQLEAAVALAVGIPPSDLRPSNVEFLLDLDASNRYIADLTGISYCRGLTTLDLGGNEIVDISNLTGMDGLRVLVLNDNQIVDITGLHTMDGLDWLDLRNNQITNINAFRWNTWVEEGDRLFVQGNPLEMWVGSAAVRTLFEVYNQRAVLSYEPLYFLDENLEVGILEALGLSPRDFMLPNLNDLSQLTILSLESFSITDITGLEYATSLTHLVLSNNEIEDISSLAGLQSLTRLSLLGNRIQDIEPLRNLLYIESLYLNRNQITNLWPLSNMNEVERLVLANNPLSDITPIALLAALSDLRVNETNVDTVADLVDNPEFADGDMLEVNGSALDMTIGSRDVQDLCALEARGVELYADSIRFPDAAVTTGVLEALGKPDGSIGCADLGTISSLTALDLSGRGVTDLSGIGHLAALQQLDLSSNQLDEITPLTDLSALRSLNLSGNHLTDLAVLVDHAGMDQGDELWLADNPLLPLWEGTDAHDQILALGNRGVTVHHDGVGANPFPDSVLEQAVRSALQMGELEIFTTAGLAGLTELDLMLSGVENLEGLQYCPNLATLNVRETPVANLAPLRWAAALRELNLSLSQVADLSPLAELTSLAELNLFGAPIADWTAVSALIGLQQLIFGDTGAIDLDWIAPLTGLATLWVQDATPIDLAPMAGLTALRELTWENGAIEDISPLGNLSGLETLILGWNQIADISALATLSSVRTLGLGYNQIQDISALEQLTNLEGLYLDGNLLDNLLPLVRNEGLGDGDTVTLYDNDALDLYLLADGGSILLLVERGVQVFHDPVEDYDGIDAGEEMGPSGIDRGYDGNDDGTPDHLQANVTSFHNHDGGQYVTVEVNLPNWLANVSSEEVPRPEQLPAEVELPLGMFSFRIDGVPLDGIAQVRLFLEEGTTLNSYWKYGVTPDDDTAHWYEFLYDGRTGAEIDGNVVTLHFANEERGDASLGFTWILDPGGPALMPPPPSGGGGGGGCFLKSLAPGRH